jgi:outer membrane receptor protein involved in Fe transport
MTTPLFATRYLRAAVITGLLFGSPLLAQTLPPATPESEEQPIVLSPFTVTTDNKGYLAANALSGTRLNTSLDNIPSSITVITKLQLEDIAASDINDVFLYEASTEGTGNYTSILTNRDGGVRDDVQGSPSTANRIRGLGSANVAVGNFAANPLIPVDMYNIDAIEISRGPNSNIFGLGNPSGTVNLVPAYANLARPINTVTLRVDDRGGFRTAVDFSRPLVQDKLALRFSAVNEEKGFVRKPSREEIRRIQGSIQFRPFANTTFKASAESYRNDNQRPNALTPRESVTDWRANGSPVFNPVTRIVTFANGTTAGPFNVNQDNSLPLGLISRGNALYNRTPIQVETNGTVSYWSVARTGNAATPLTRNQNIRFLESGTDISRNRSNQPLFFEPGTRDQALYDWTKYNLMAPNQNEDRAETYMVELEQILLDRGDHLVAARAGFFRQDFERRSRDMIGSNDMMIYVDVNTHRLDGTPNPHLGRPYISSGNQVKFRTPDNEDTISADLVYRLTPNRRGVGWLGQQTVNLHWERRDKESVNYRFTEYILSDHAWINPANRTNNIQNMFQFYLGDGQGQNIDYAPTGRADLSGTYPFTWFNGPANQWVTEQARLGLGSVSNTRTRPRIIDTANVTYQGNFFQDRFIGTVGFRRDKQKSNTSDAWTIDPATGLFDPNSPALRNYPNADVVQEGDTVTFGGVVKVTPNLRFFYNWSDSFTPEPTRYDINEVLMGNPTAEGTDYGIALTLLDGKLVVKVNRYEVLEKQARLEQLGTIGSRTHILEGGRDEDPRSFLMWAQGVAAGRFANQGVTPTADQLYAAGAAIIGLTPEFLRSSAVTGAVGVAGDRKSTGWEIEAVYNPTSNWRMKINAVQMRSVDSNLAGDLTEYFQRRLPIWQSVTDDNGNRWWDANNGYALTQWLGSIRAPYLFEVANDGKSRSQIREWRLNALTNYDITEGRLKGWNVGGALRWEDKAAIGYLGRPPEGGQILELDPNKPVYDKARAYFDLSVGYRFKLANDRIRVRTQLNVRDIFEDGRLQSIAVDPLGRPIVSRIIDPRQFILTTTFEF